MPMHKTLHLPSSTGATLAIRRALAASPRGTVQISHGLGEHGGRYGAFAGFLAEHGFHVYVHDHRGHGETQAPGTPRGGLGGLAKVDADLFDLHEFIAAEHPGLPVFAFGQGTGALIAYHFLFGHAPRLAGAALWNLPAASDHAVRFLSGMLRWERFRLGSDVPSPTMRRIIAGWNRKSGENRTGFDWLSADAEVVDTYAADPLSGIEPPIGAWLDMIRLTRRVATKAGWSGLQRDLPIHLMAGEADPATGFGQQGAALARRLENLGFSEVTFSLQAGLRHDLVNGSRREEVWREFVDWLNVASGSTASP